MTSGFKQGEVYKFGYIPDNQYWSNVTFEVIQDGPSQGYIHVKVLDPANGNLRNGQLHQPFISKEGTGSNLKLLTPAFESGTRLAKSYTEAKLEMNEFFEPFIDKAVELASYSKGFDKRDYMGPWSLQFFTADAIEFESEQYEVDYGFGDRESFGGYRVTLTKEFMANPDKVVAAAKLEKETRERDDRRIAKINARNKIAKLEKDLDKARKEMNDFE